MDKPKDTMASLKDVLSNILNDPSLPFNPDDARIWKVWGEVVGPAVEQNTRPRWIKDGRLRVEVKDPIWLQELGFVEQGIAGKLNKRLGRVAVKKIEFRLTSK